MLGWSLDSLLEGNASGGDDNLQMPKGTTKHYLNLVWLSKCWKEIPFEANTYCRIMTNIEKELQHK